VSVAIEGLPRRVIPRWRDFRTAAELGEFSVAARVENRVEVPSGLDSLLRLWQSQRSEVLAGELLSASWLEGAWDTAREAAKYLLRRGSAAQELTRNFARSVIEDLSAAQKGQSATRLDRAAVQNIRAALRLYPRDAIGWCELARYYTIVGKLKRARRAMCTAVALAPDNRFILRSASRCFVHLGEPDMALNILRRSGIAKSDPWLAAAHVSIAQIMGKATRLYRQARELSKSESFAPFHLAELNAALGTMEMSAGNEKGARKMLQAALTDPTENALAQAWWAQSRVRIQLKPTQLRAPHTFEANTRALVVAEKWESALHAAAEWFRDEPFSTNPALQQSFILSVAFEQHEQAIDILKLALRSNPGDLLLLNNLAFALGDLGRTYEAREILAHVNVEDTPADRAVALIATEGLLRFRERDINSGREFYARAIRLAKDHQQDRQAALAALYLAKEEKRANSDMKDLAISEAEKAASRFDDSTFRLVMRTLREGPLPKSQPEARDQDTPLIAAP